MQVNKVTHNFPERPEQQLGRNHFDHSHPHLDTFTMGEIVPFFCKETMPNDYWEISSEHFYRFPAAYLPIYHRINSQVAYFYVPWRIIWPGTKQDSWEWFIRDEASVELPYVNYPVSSLDDIWQSTTVGEHLGIPSCQTSLDVSIDTLKINAGPFSAILKIWDEYYRNDQIQGARWFELTGGDNSTAMEAAFPEYNPGVGAHQKYLCLLRNWNRDYFTSATPTPQVGANVLVPMMRNNSVDEGTWSYLGPTHLYNFDGTPAADSTLSSNSGKLSTTAQNVYLDIQETAASIRDLRFALMLTEYLEKLMRLGDRYRDFIKGMWSVDPFPLLVDRPLYLGGTTGLVNVSEVMSHAETLDSNDDIVSSVGSYGGQLLHMSQTGKVRYHCMEHGFIIGLVTVYPKTMYFQGLERMWTRTTKYDYPLDQFNFIGDDALLHREVMFSYLDSDNTPAGASWNEGIFGYIPRYSDWRYSNAVISGKMRDSQGPLFSFHLGRFFDVNDSASLQLNSEFLECVPDKQRIFQLANEREEEVWCYIWNEAHVTRQLSKFGIPGL